MPKIIEMTCPPKSALSARHGVMRAVNPAPMRPVRSGRRQPARSLVVKGTKILKRVSASGRDTDLASEDRIAVQKVWEALVIAYESTEADRRTALTRLQSLLRKFTEDDADFASDAEAQSLRRDLHVWLDH